MASECTRPQTSVRAIQDRLGPTGPLAQSRPSIPGRVGGDSERNLLVILYHLTRCHEHGVDFDPGSVLGSEVIVRRHYRLTVDVTIP
jgi:hypothetical protein